MPKGKLGAVALGALRSNVATRRWPLATISVISTNRLLPLLLLSGVLVSGCSTVSRHFPTDSGSLAADPVRVLDRMSWGANPSSAREVMRMGIGQYIASQLKPDATPDLPEAVEAQIAAMTITQKSLLPLVGQLEQQRKEADAIKSDEDKKAAQQSYQQELTRLAREASTRALLRALYSSNQLREQMTWFWFDHFNVHQYKANLRAMVGDYEDRAIRPHALGHFRDLLRAVVYHPAMLIYLDNAQNAAGRINENFAREVMELHTLGVDGGYSQRDVQELARILTGVGVNLGSITPNVKRELQSQYLRDGLFEFNPNRHDYGDKQFLGQRVQGAGLKEVDEALDRLARLPSTARFISRKLATYFVSDDPPSALVERMAGEFERSDGDIAATLAALFASPEFAASLGGKFKDPIHYVVSAVRLAYDDKPILNAGPMINWLNRMAEPLYGRQTPDGYPMTSAAWASPGQMATRFEIAKAIGTGSAGLFRGEAPSTGERPAFPQLSNALFYGSLQPKLSKPTIEALDQANSPQEWNTFLLASPEFMNR
jgi:uncharacterized protein (DUF1800 family)